MDKRLVLFDLDGTLVDSEDFIVWTFMEAGRELGVDLDPSAIRRAIGLPIDSFVENVLGHLPREVVNVLVERRRELMKRHWRSMVRLFPDVVPVLESLRSNGFLLAVASSSIVERIVEFLEHFGVLEYFDYISGVKPGVRGKPAPDVILVALRELGVDPGEAVYVGDRFVDCVAAHSAGVDFVFLDRSRLGLGSDSCKPLAVISSLTGLPGLLFSERSTSSSLES